MRWPARTTVRGACARPTVGKEISSANSAAVRKDFMAAFINGDATDCKWDGISRFFLPIRVARLRAIAACGRESDGQSPSPRALRRRCKRWGRRWVNPALLKG